MTPIALCRNLALAICILLLTTPSLAKDITLVDDVTQAKLAAHDSPIDVLSVTAHNNEVPVPEDATVSTDGSIDEDTNTTNRQAVASTTEKVDSNVDLDETSGTTIKKTGKEVLDAVTGREVCRFRIGPWNHYSAPAEHANCMCSRSGRGRIYFLAPALATCLRTCFQPHIGSPCNYNNGHNDFSDEFGECCTKCKGTVGPYSARQTSTNRQVTFTGCRGPSCAFRITPYSGYNMPVTGATCMCGNSGRGRAYALEPPVSSCMNTCMQREKNKPCNPAEGHNGFEDEFTSCCSSCNGRKTTLPVTRGTFRGNFVGCAANSCVGSATATTRTNSVLQVPLTSGRCTCGGTSRYRHFVVLPPLVSCFQSCMGSSSSCALSSYSTDLFKKYETCCARCSGKARRIPIPVRGRNHYYDACVPGFC